MIQAFKIEEKFGNIDVLYDYLMKNVDHWQVLRNRVEKPLKGAHFAFQVWSQLQKEKFYSICQKKLCLTSEN